MTSTEHPVVRQPLPDSVMSMIRVVAESEMAPADKFESILLAVTGYGLYMQTEKVNPTLYQIPTDQWKEISGLMTALDRGASEVARVNAALSYLNLGPSSYEPEEGTG